MFNLRNKIHPSPVGDLLLVAGSLLEGAEPKLLKISFLGERGEGTERDFPDDGDPSPRDTFLGTVSGQLDEYFQRQRKVFDVPLHLVGTPFQLKVWQALQEIPFGSTWSYGQQAAHVGCSGGARAVGAANGRNPISIIIPCHRVVGANGGLVGFGGGLPKKVQLLDFEQPSLFS